jgi:hypothetical protein
MEKKLLPMAVVVAVLAGYSLHWPGRNQPSEIGPSLTAQEISASEAAHRHKLGQPSHWRALLLRQRY